MPVREYASPKRAPEADSLLRDLLDEWRSPSEGDDNGEPLILIDRQRPLDAIHLFVVWDRWGGVEQIERSEIITEACARQLDENEVLEVTVAMGLTREEADRMGIGREPDLASSSAPTAAVG